MARIRSIKPEFFSSETMAKVPRATRLTFIGLWTYVDDNGVGIDNDRLITAALYALDEDFVEELIATREDLAALERIGVIARYTVAGKRYLHITSWDEHQKISHPGKPRYPLPPHPSGNPPEDLANPSGTPPEPLRPEVGAGSREREQGAGNPAPAPASQPPLIDEDPQPLAPLADPDSSMPGFADFWKPWPRKVDKAPAEKAWKNALTKTRASPQTIIDACVAYAERCALTNRDPEYIPYPATWLNKQRWNDDLDAVMPLTRASPTSHQTYADPPSSAYYNPKQGRP